MELPQLKMFLYTILAHCSSILVLPCTRVFLLILRMPQTSSRPRAFLVANLAMAALVLSFLINATEFEKLHGILVYNEVVTILKAVQDFLLALIPLIMAAISLDMISIDDPVGDRPRMTKSILVKIWICAAVFTFVSKVQVANLFQLAEQRYYYRRIKQVVEILRAILFDSVPVGCIINCFCKSLSNIRRSRINNSSQINGCMEAKKEIYVLSILQLIFIMIWFPFGWIEFVYQISTIYDIPVYAIDLLLDMERFLLVLFVLSYPVIYSRTSADLRHIPWLTFSWLPPPVTMTQNARQVLSEMEEGSRTEENIRVSGHLKATHLVTNGQDARILLETLLMEENSDEATESAGTPESKINYFSPSSSSTNGTTYTDHDDGYAA